MPSDDKVQTREFIAKRLKHYRKIRGVTQEQILNDTGIHIARVEAKYINLTVAQLKKLCDYLEISLSEFFVGL